MAHNRLATYEALIVGAGTVVDPDADDDVEPALVVVTVGVAAGVVAVVVVEPDVGKRVNVKAGFGADVACRCAR